MLSQKNHDSALDRLSGISRLHPYVKAKILYPNQCDAKSEKNRNFRVYDRILSTVVN